ncbi:MAG: DsbA family protein [bacterium]
MEIIYVADPMCSWCWGFAPVLDALREKYQEQFDFRMVLGGLRPGPAAVRLDDAAKADIEHHWRSVHEMTQQPFDFTFFERDGFVYDTEPACRAVVAMRELSPAHEYPFFKRLQQAFYAQNVDITRMEQLVSLAKQFDLEESAFSDRLASDAILEATRLDFLEARQLGVRGFPTLLLRIEKTGYFLSHGYQTFNQIDLRMQEVLTQEKIS